MKIIDVSVFQGTIDWSKVKADGVDMAIIKATQGHSLSQNHYLFTDSKFTINIKGAIAAGIPVGVYHFFTGRTRDDVIKEADYFCKVIAPYKKDIIFVFCDAENYNNKYLLGLSKTELSSRINDFCARVESNGYRVAHYTNIDHIQSYINLSSIPYPVWVAKYSGSKPNVHNMIAWQYTSTGKIDGIRGNVDISEGYFNLKDYIKPDKVDSHAEINAGDTVRVSKTFMQLGQKRAKLYGGNGSFRVAYDRYTVYQINKSTGRAVISYNGTIIAAVDISILEKVI